jgi:2,4-dienoyl-CoA reductase-like NADH-dependent reductase (Old Yellow Enzyme family)
LDAKTDHPLLFTPLRVRGVTLPNRLVVPPMAQYSAVDGVATDFHREHYGRLAVGGAGLIFVEATGVTAEGRITNGCLGLWNDVQRAALAPIAAAMKAQGAVPAIQIGHGGRKAAMQRPWFGNGPLTDADLARGERRWQPLGPSAAPLSEGWLVPRAMDAADMARTRRAFADAACRALEAGFEVIEIHMAHGYLLQSFVSPLSNLRTDAWGGSLEGRMRFPLEVAESVRAALPDDVPLFARISCEDGIEGGWTMDDSVAFARALGQRGVDVIDCSSGGNTPRGATNANLQRSPGYQVPYARRIRAESGVMTEAVGRTGAARRRSRPRRRRAAVPLRALLGPARRAPAGHRPRLPPLAAPVRLVAREVGQGHPGARGGRTRRVLTLSRRSPAGSRRWIRAAARRQRRPSRWARH